MIDFLSQPWAWYVAGPLIALTLFLNLYFGKRFGLSSNLQTACSIAGAGQYSDYFKFDWKTKSWNLVFVLGAVIGGFIAAQFLASPEAIALHPDTVRYLETEFGFSNVGGEYLPAEVFGVEQMLSVGGLAILLIGGFLVGFGARYAGGCTSGHAISGMSDLQLPSLIAVTGFFIGGLTMVHFIMPLIF